MDKKSYHGLSTARVVALLAVASGDQHQDIAERSLSYLKAHLDSLKNRTILKNEDGGDSWKERDDEKIDLASKLVGNPIALACRE